MTRPNRIDLVKIELYDEAVASGVCSPGHFLTKGSDGKVSKNSGKGAGGRMLIAFENRLLGKTVENAYAVDDVVPYGEPEEGDRVLARIAAGVAVTNQQKLQLDGAGGLMPFQDPRLYQSTADGTALTNSTTETALGSFSIPKNVLAVGDVIRVRAAVDVPNTNSTDTLNLKLTFGGTTVFASGAVNVADNDKGVIEANLVVTALGETGSFRASGRTVLGVPGTAVSKDQVLGATAVDTTGAVVVAVTGTWSVANAGNSCTLKSLSGDLIRTGGVHAVAVAEEAVDNGEGTSDEFVRVTILPNG